MHTELKDPSINEDNVQGKCKITIFKSGSTWFISQIGTIKFNLLSEEEQSTGVSK